MNINALANIKSGERFILSGDSVTVQTTPKSFWQWFTGAARLTPTLTKINEYIEKNKEEILKSPETKKDLKALKIRLDVAVQSYKDKHSRLYLWFFGRHVERECDKIKNNIQGVLDTVVQHKEVKINSSALEILNQLFKESPYSIEELPVYPITLSKEHPFPTLEEMGSNSVMIGRIQCGYPFIALQLNTTLSEEQINGKGYRQSILNGLTETPDRQQLLVLYETSRFEWTYLYVEGEYAHTKFFDSYESMQLKDHNCLLRYQKEGFELLKKVIQQGSGPDKNGVIWTIPTYN